MLESVKWSVFSLEEKEGIEKLLSLGERSSIVTIIEEMTPEKEYEIQKIMDGTKSEIPTYESSVLSDYNKAHPEGPQSPQEEAELQAALDAEVKREQERQVALRETRNENLKQLDISERFCQKCDSKGVRHLKTCPTLIQE